MISAIGRRVKVGNLLDENRSHSVSFRLFRQKLKDSDKLYKINSMQFWKRAEFCQTYKKIAKKSTLHSILRFLGKL